MVSGLPIDLSDGVLDNHPRCVECNRYVPEDRIPGYRVEVKKPLYCHKRCSNKASDRKRRAAKKAATGVA